MLKNLMASFILFGFVGLPASADVLILDEPQEIQGTFQGYHMGQILMRTEVGQDLQLPSMTLFWHADPPVQASTLQVGQNIRILLPENARLTVIDSAKYPTVLGDYEGVHLIPNETVTSWRTVDVEAASR